MKFAKIISWIIGRCTPEPPSLPMLGNGDLEIWKDAFLSLGKKEISVLEWGGGSSTTWFPIWLCKKRIKYNWDTIESNVGWYEHIRRQSVEHGLKNVNIHFAFKRHEYGTLPLSFKRKYDVIIIDGSFRKFCLKRIHLLLKDRGIVIVHDANWYRQRLDSDRYLQGKYVGERTWIAKFKI